MADATSRPFILGLMAGPAGEGAREAEEAGFDLVLLGGVTDPEQAAIGQDPLSAAATLMTVTSRIGLCATVPTNWPPFNVARALASFDLLSGGRLGWLPWPPSDGDPARFAEHLDVVAQLFDSWEDEALLFDKQNSRFADPARVHRIRHEGAHYTVDGPLNVPRPVQGHPVLLQPLAQASAQTDLILVTPDELGAAALPGRRLVMAPLALGPPKLAVLAGQADGLLLDPGPGLADIAHHLAAIRAALPSASPGGTDFHARLGLPRPVNRFAAVAA